MKITDINKGSYIRIFIILFVVLLAVACASHPLAISYQVHVPDAFKQDPPGWKSPNGEPESVRYMGSFEAFWWNCVIVKAEDFEARCPFTCSGTPAASLGCSDGAMDAENQIQQLLSYHDATKVKKYLQSMVEDSAGRTKIGSYFPNGPRSEKIIK